MFDIKSLRRRHELLCADGRGANVERGQPSDENLALSRPILSIVGPEQCLTPSGINLLNYPGDSKSAGGAAGLWEARELFADLIGANPDETIVGNNSSLNMIWQVLVWALIRGLSLNACPWMGTRPRAIVLTPGYDRHNTMLRSLGFDLVTVAMTSSGPDMDAVEEAVSGDPRIKVMVVVPNWQNPTGITFAGNAVKRLASMPTAAKDFRLIVDDAYRLHGLVDSPARPVVNMLQACKDAGNPERAIVFCSTSKITFAGAGVAIMAAAKKLLDHMLALFRTQGIGPNKLEQYRHYLFLSRFPGGVRGLMQQHAAIIRPKFEAAFRVLRRELEGKDAASWIEPDGGYSITTTLHFPVAQRTWDLANEAGVVLTPPGATHPHGVRGDPHTLRLAVTRSETTQDVEYGVEVFCVSALLATAEHMAYRR